jgi:hypothetical protein
MSHSVIIPINIPVTRQDGTVVTIPHVTLLAWKHALRFEVKTGMPVSRISASATAKRLLGLPKGWTKVKVLEVVTDLVDQMKMQAAG